jgi:hypothetical protein
MKSHCNRLTLEALHLIAVEAEGDLLAMREIQHWMFLDQVQNLSPQNRKIFSTIYGKDIITKLNKNSNRLMKALAPRIMYRAVRTVNKLQKGSILMIFCRVAARSGS